MVDNVLEVLHERDVQQPAKASWMFSFLEVEMALQTIGLFGYVGS